MLIPRMDYPPGGGSGVPSDWPALPNVAGDNVTGLYAVWNDDGNFAALTMTTSGGANYRVDWGDGTVDNVASAATVYHTYSYASAGLVGPVSGGFKIALVTVTPVSGSFTVANLQVKHNQAGLNTYSTGWLDLRMYVPSSANISISASAPVVLFQMLRRAVVNCIDGSLDTLFYNCSALNIIDVTTTPAVTCTNFALGCSGLESVSLSFPGGVTNASGMFYQCFGLLYVPLFPTSACTNFSLFATNSGLREVPAYDLSAVTTISTPFSGCASLSRFLATGLTRGISFSGCNLSTAAINEMFTGLGTAFGAQTVTTTSNYGTPGNTAIATGKGWTVVS